MTGNLTADTGLTAADVAEVLLVVRGEGGSA